MKCVLILISRFESYSKKRATVEMIMMLFALKIMMKKVSIMLDHFLEEVMMLVFREASS